MNNSLILDSDIIDQEMQQAFRRSHGLTMLDFRTGSGKSFDLEKNIARFISNWHDGKSLMVGDSPETLRSIEQIVVVIPNKNNFLSLDGLADRLMEVSPNINILPEAKRIIQESVFVMPNNLDCMIEGLCHNGYVDDIKMNEILGSIEMLFKSSLIAKKLKRNFMSIANYAKQRNLQYTENLSESELKKYILEDLKNVANNAEKDIRENLRDFISNCKKIEKSEKVSEKERRIATIEKEKCIKLVTSFYKIACHDKYRVLIMTVDKFMNQIDPIISGKFYFYDSFYKKNFIEEKLFIFDESDSAYIKMRDCIITGINNGFPFKEYLKSLICNYLVNTQPTQAVANAIKEAKLKHGKKYSLQYFQKRGNEIFEKYYLNYSYKTDEASEKNGKMPAILNDGTLYTLSEKKGYIHAVKSEIRKQVLLRVGNSSKDKPNILKDGEAVNIAQFFIEGTALIYDFCRFLNIVTQNYHNFMNRNEAEKAKKIEEETGKHVSEKRDVAFWDDFKTILHMFSVNNKEERDFYITVCRNLKNHPKRITLLDPDNSFYIRGYDLKMIRDNPVNQAENSIIYSYGVNVTPESILLKMAQLTHVICLSATALNRSVSENFDVSYLKRKLGDRFYTVSEKKKKELRAFYARREEPYVNGTCQIDVVILPENNAIVFEDNGYYRLKTETVLPTFCHPEIKKRILEMVSDNISQNGGGDYQKGRYLNLIRAIYEFIKTPSLVSMLVLENILLKETHTGSFNEFDLKLMREVIKEICDDLGVRLVPLVTASASDFEAKKKEIFGYWEKGEKAIFCSTYQTTSKGSNLQHKIPDNAESRNCLTTLLPELSKDSRFLGKYGFKDVDCLYCGTITHLLPSINDDESKDKSDSKIKTECFHKGIFIFQKLAYGDQISFSQKQKIIRNWYRTIYHEAKTGFGGFLKRTEGISNTVNKIIKQSVGRIDRVNKKNTLTKIFITTDNLKLIDLNELADTEHDLVPAMKEIFKAAKLVQGGFNEENEKTKQESITLIKCANQHNKSVEAFRTLLWYLSQPGKTIEKDLAIQEYTCIRNLVIQHPVLSEKVFNSLPNESQQLVKKYYFDSNRDDVFSYVFTINPKEDDSDLDNCHITIEGFNSAAKGHCIAEENTVLGSVCKINGVVSAFKQKGYCIKWEPGRYILSPKCMDIYNGILGEEVEKIILQQIIQEVENIDGKLYLPSVEDLAPEVFERFDFRYGNLYIDAKNWRYGVRDSDAMEFKKKVLAKKAECDAFYNQCGTAVILNLLPLDEMEHKPSSETGYHVIPALIDVNGKLNERAFHILWDLFRKANKNAGKNQ